MLGLHNTPDASGNTFLFNGLEHSGPERERNSPAKRAESPGKRAESPGKRAQSCRETGGIPLEMGGIPRPCHNLCWQEGLGENGLVVSPFGRDNSQNIANHSGLGASWASSICRVATTAFFLGSCVFPPIPGVFFLETKAEM